MPAGTRRRCSPGRDPPDDTRLGALYRFAHELVASRGHVSQTRTQALLNAGYSPAALLEVMAKATGTDSTTAR